MGPAEITQLLMAAALAMMMLSMGLKVEFEEVVASARQTRLMILGLLANFVLVPLVTVGLLYGFAAEAMISVGFLILAVCPGAPLGPPFAALAKGNVSCAIGLMVILSGLSAVLSPALLTGLLAYLAPDNDLHIDYLAIVRTLLLAQMLPLGIGLALHRCARKLSDILNRPVALVANLLLIAGVGLILATQYETLSAIRPRGWAGMLLLLLASLAIGWLCGGPTRATRTALALTTANRNAAVGLVIVSTNFAGTPAVISVVAYALVSIFGALGSALIIARFAGSDTSTPGDERCRPSIETL
jgi:BASS family bile acid:Na+ symporter